MYNVNVTEILLLYAEYIFEKLQIDGNYLCSVFCLSALLQYCI